MYIDGSSTRGGRVIFLIWFCFNTDGLLNELIKSNVGCHTGEVFAGGFGFDDGITLLTPT